MTPPSPWIGSTMIATVSSPIAASAARRGRRRARSGSRGSSGSKPRWYFACPVAASVAMVRPWKRAQRGQDLEASAARVAVATRELDRRLVRLGAAVAEEALARRTSARYSSSASLRLRLAVVQVRDVHERFRLTLDRRGHGGMAVAQVGAEDAREEVEDAAPVGVPELGAAAAHEHERGPRVDRNQMARGALDDVLAPGRPGRARSRRGCGALGGAHERPVRAHALAAPPRHGPRYRCRGR